MTMTNKILRAALTVTADAMATLSKEELASLSADKIIIEIWKLLEQRHPAKVAELTTFREEARRWRIAL
jgi:hypothetical protein